MKENEILTRFILLFISAFLCMNCNALQNKFNSIASYQVCFTPKSDCTQLIVDSINSAKKSIYVQAYSFTSAPIAKALVDAHKKGIKVEVILDKSQYKSERYSSAKFLNNFNVPVSIDYKPSIAHNKIMIIDNQSVITGSFNFTKAAQFRNTENVIIINDSKLSSIYFNNFIERHQQAVPFNQIEQFLDSRKRR